MAFGAFLSACCVSRDRDASNLDSENRRARIVAVTSDGHNPPRRQRHNDSPPRYADVVQQPFSTMDGKNREGFVAIVEDEDNLPPPISPNSSVVSIPSTRLTALTSTYTGETARINARQSLDQSSTRESRPPSYYSNTHNVRSVSPASVAISERDSIWRHPVMARNWLEVLQQEALREATLRADGASEHDHEGERGAAG